MKIDGIPLIALIVALVLIPVVYCESANIGSGSLVAIRGDSSAEGILTSDGTITQSTVSSEGVIDELNIDPWVKNSKGDYAEIGVTGTNIAGFTYNDNYYPVKNNVGVSHAVWAQQWLGASYAESLHAYAKASNSAGDSAGADFFLSKGSLNGYYNAAYAGPATDQGMDRVASVQQILNFADGNQILALTWAVDSVGDAAGTSTAVANGVLNGYSVLADAARYSNGLRAAGVRIDSMSASSHSGSIDQTMCAVDYWGDESLVNIYMNKGNLYSYSSYGPSIAYSINDWRQTFTQQSYDAEAIGIGNYFDRYRSAHFVTMAPFAYHEVMYGRQKNWDYAGTDVGAGQGAEYTGGGIGGGGAI